MIKPINRREFLRIATISGLWAIGESSILNLFANKGEACGKKASKRWALLIDMNKLGDYQRCIDACHFLHNVPKISNPKHEIKWLFREKFCNAFVEQRDDYIAETIKFKQFLVLCNHCKNPPCVRVCPTKATFRREDGIVDIDYHRCIGCRFCMAGCPFGARSFNWIDPKPFIPKINYDFPIRTKGVVEKCNFCVERLAVGKEPACVEASEGGLVFGDLNDSNDKIRKILSENYSIRRKPELGTYPSVYYII